MVGPKGLSWRSCHFEPSTSAVCIRLRVSPALRKIVIPHGQQTRCMPKASGALNGVVLSSSLARHRRHLIDYGPTGRRRSGPTELDSHAATVFNVSYGAFAFVTNEAQTAGNTNHRVKLIRKGIVGKTNMGKTTFFNASTLANRSFYLPVHHKTA